MKEASSEEATFEANLPLVVDPHMDWDLPQLDEGCLPTWLLHAVCVHPSDVNLHSVLTFSNRYQ